MSGPVVHLIGPGGAGKSTAGALLAQELGYSLVDLDEYFLAHTGDISAFLASHTYFEYAARNLANYHQAVERISGPAVLVLSSGFMVYPPEIDPGYLATRDSIEGDALTFLLMPSFELESCVSIIVERQLARTYLPGDRDREERRIRERYGRYAALRCQRVSTEVPPERVVADLIARMATNGHSRLP
jgi:shikimate kinase